jgi:hypothetical protein
VLAGLRAWCPRAAMHGDSGSRDGDSAMGAAPVAQSSQSVESGHMHACWGVWHLHAPSHARARAPAELSSRDLCQVPNRSRRPRGPVPLRDCVLSRGLWRVAMPVVVVLGRQVGGVVGRVLEVGGGGPMTRSQQRREKRGKKKKKGSANPAAMSSGGHSETGRGLRLPSNSGYGAVQVWAPPSAPPIRP